MLVQIPHGFFAAEARAARLRAAGARPTTASAFCSCRATPDGRADRRGDRRPRSSPTRARCCSAGATCRSTSRCSARACKADRAGACGRCSSGAAPASPTRTISSAGCSSCARSISGAVYELRRPARSADFYPVSMSCRTVVYKGMLLATQLGAYYKDLQRPALRQRAGARASALLDQHLPVLVAGPSLPDGRAQRRDQHAARQRQLDGGAAGLGRVASCSATTSRSCGRSPTRASRTRPASTTRSSSWCRAATRSPMR